jgi:diacylglycerol kinase (ATP)
VDAALEICLSGAAQPMDVLLCTSGATQRTVANMATAGNTGRYTRLLTDEQKRTWGPFCYMRGALDVLQDLQVYEMECVFDGGAPERYAALNLFVANGRTSGGGVAVAPEADLADGLLDVVLVQDGAPLELAALTAGLLFSRFLENDLVVWRRCREVRIAGPRGLPFSGDGDPLGEAPAEFRVLPAALRVVRGGLSTHSD